MTIEYIACVAASLEEVVAYTRGQVRCCPSTGAAMVQGRAVEGPVVVDPTSHLPSARWR